MSLSDELNKLSELHQRGVLTDEEFTHVKIRLLAAHPVPTSNSLVANINALRRSRTDRWVAGVCGGLARSTGLESWAWRLILLALFLFGGMGLLVYVLLWIFVPSE
jgi:phage shock protein C